MAENSKIEWCHHTFNCWSGCTKVSPACDHCYAEVNYSVKMRGVKWGKYGNRIIAADSMWKQPLAWNRKAEKEGERKRVFCASLADVFEGPESMPNDAWEAVSFARERLGKLIDETPWLDWLLLTKRPENFLKYGPLGMRWTQGGIPPNVWAGTTVENQKYADLRIPELLKIPAKVRFLSMEPLLEEIVFDAFTLYDDENGERLIHWVIVGGESGSTARPMHPEWARTLRDQCVAVQVPFHFKQWGEWWPIGQMPDGVSDSYYDPKYGKRKRESYDERPAPKPVKTTVLQLDGTQEFDFPAGSMTCFKVGKEISGRILDGREWNEIPEVNAGV
jgi:protein gp37